jgi:hypothetical protein
MNVNVDDVNDEDEFYLRITEKLARKMHMGYFKRTKEENIYYQPYLTKRERWSSLTIDDKINIVHDVLIGKRP